ncbi:hypothetical protein V1525DRAFT_400294 [Lipomyces kononenkoae]|uniref:Uncharacterized protein n=1 Tax=Lipomyces kononenkoae TaxID=34357 RepID=A0ACC3T4M3_LIPKO
MSLNDLGSYLAWLVVPRAASTALQRTYYQVFFTAGHAAPRPGSPTYRRDQRISYALVIIGYLIYTTYTTVAGLVAQGNFYALLSVPINVDDKTVRRRFRNLSLFLHPDKGTGNEEAFIALKLASETLCSPVRRFAYDRFGVAALSWPEGKSQLDYVVRGIQAWVPHYVISFVIMVVLSLFRQSAFGSYWRFYAFFAEFLIELHLITRTGVQEFVATYSPYPFTIRELIVLSRSLLISLSIAAAQLGPIFFPATVEPSTKLVREQQDVMKTMVANLTRLTDAIDTEATSSFINQTQPFLLPPHLQNKLPTGTNKVGETYFKQRLQQYLVDVKLRSRPEVREAIKRVATARQAELDASVWIQRT